MIFDDYLLRDGFAYFFRKTYVVGAYLETPRRGDSNKHPNIRFYEEMAKIIFQLSPDIIKYTLYLFHCCHLC